jgi:metal-dependent hydrolase (beta-lactamase superfamily II)
MAIGWPKNGLLTGHMEKSTEIEGVIVEFHQVGNAVKVSAVDTKTFLEVSIMAPAHCTEQEMTDSVLRKLDYIREKRRGRQGSPLKR